MTSDPVLITRAIRAVGAQERSFLRNGDGRLPKHPRAVADRHRAARWLRHFAVRGVLMSYPEIARVLGWRSHTTALAACRRLDTPAPARYHAVT